MKTIVAVRKLWRLDSKLWRGPFRPALAALKGPPHIDLLRSAILVAAIASVAAQPPSPSSAGQGRQGRGSTGSGQGRDMRPRGADPLVLDDHAGFDSIFDGKTLNGWDGDPSLWRVENGTIVGESTEQNPVKQNTFLIWRGGEPKDFELKVEFRMNSTNSGIQIRSVQLPPGPDIGKWVMKGYQADIDFANQFTGQIYEERGRGFLAMRGQTVYVPDNGRPKVIGNLQQSADELKAVIKTNDWNQVHIIARGNTIIQILNGAVTSIVVDDDSKNRVLSGLLGFQMHVGPPMKVEFRNIWLRRL